MCLAMENGTEVRLHPMVDHTLVTTALFEAWSERSFEWDRITDRDREELTIRCRAEGEFWMPFEELINNFTNLDLIHIGPDDWMQVFGRF